MKKIENIVPLTEEELRNTEGGFAIILAACALGVAGFGLGYAMGKDLYHIVN